MPMPVFSYRSRIYFALFGLIFITSLTACTQRSGDQSSFSSEKAKTQTIKVRYAEGFSVEEFKNFTLLRIFNPFQNQSDTLRYMLVSGGETVPENTGNAQVIRTPIESMIATSTTHVALTEMLESNRVIKGMVGAEYVYSRKVRERLQTGDVTSFTQGEFNNEVALDINPDLVMISAGQASQYDNYRLLVEAGIAVFVNAEWLETTPLGKAEWVKVMGLLLEKTGQANQAFQKVAENYNRLKSKAKNADSQPLVINNMPYKGAWFVSGGNSFTAQFLKDAKADYPWYETDETGGLRLNFETVYEQGLKAEVWLNPGTAKNKDDILAKDARFQDFKSFRNGRIYNNNKRMGPTGGNDYWETGVVRPDLILSDFITILHPSIMESDSLYFYQKVD